MLLENNIINFTISKDEKLKEAIQYYKSETADVALEKLIDLINEGHSDAYVYVGGIYEVGGSGVAIDYEKALFYYERSIEESGSVAAHQALGRLYYYGLGVDKDYKAAFGYYKIIDDETEDSIACLMLGQMYNHGFGVARDIEIAREYYNKAIDLENIPAITCLAMMEKEHGNALKSIVLRIKAVWLTLVIMMRDANDIRLRWY